MRARSYLKRASGVAQMIGALALALAVTACGAAGGPTSPPSPEPAPSPTPPPTPSAPDACLVALQLADDRTVDGLQVAGRKLVSAFGHDKVGVDDILWSHWSRPDLRVVTQAQVDAAATTDIGDIVVIEDDGTAIRPANPFDLTRAGLRVRPLDNSYDVTAVDGAFRTPLGARLSLADDDSVSVALPVPLPFGGQLRRAAFVNSDGNVTFEEGDAATSERSVARVVNGAPRLAPFFADLDPSAGGRVFVNAQPDALTVTWCGVPGFGRSETASVQVSLLSDGTVEIAFGDTHTLADGVVAVAGGRGAPFVPLDLSTGGRGAGAVGERFATQSDLDLVSLAARFYRTHDDVFDQLVVFGDQRLISSADAFAFETSVNNAVQGIGADVFNRAREFGSAGRLQSLVNMDRLGKYPADPLARVLGENSTLSVLAHEVGHRWLAFLPFRGLDGSSSRALLGRDDSHWSFFFDSDASVMEGNDIEDLGGGSFRTVDAVRRYSALDQYAMGLIAPSQVPKFFYVEGVVNAAPDQTNVSPPRVGVTFTGTRRDLLVEDVIAVLGDRRPSATDSPKVFAQAFVYLVGRGRSASADDVARIDRIRREFEGFFARATSNRMRLTTTLR